MESEVKIVRAILRQNEFFLRRHLILSKTVLDNLKSNGLITDVTRGKILLEPAYKQVPILIKCLEYKGVQSLRKFLEVLRNTGHGWMVDTILDTDIAAGGGGRRSRDDNDYSSIKRNLYESLRSENRKSVTAGAPYQSYQHNEPSGSGVSLATLLRAREHVDKPEWAPRGIINTRTLLTDPIATGPGYQVQPRHYPMVAPYNRHMVPYPGSKEEIPLTLYDLNQAFSEQDQRNQQALSVLRQEEVAIRQLMEQNYRDQGNVRRRQAAVHDIVSSLRDIHNRAKEVIEPSPHPNIGAYRLAQLNQIPWSIDN